MGLYNAHQFEKQGMKVKIGFMQGAEEWQIDGFLCRFRKIDPSILELEIDRDNADFLIAFPWLYTSSKEMYLQFLQDSIGKITIMDVYGEALAPDLNLFDYHIGFDSADHGGRVLEMPFLSSYRVQADQLPLENVADVLNRKSGFCNYIYSHGEGHPYRIQLFSRLSEYKKINSIGKHLNNTPCSVPRESDDWLKGSILLKNPYKFSFACENAWYRGYSTEKIITSFLARSIPIYWGNPLIEEDYNPRAFINCHRYSSLDEVVAEIKRIDEDDESWLAMMAEPKRLPWQIERAQEKEARLKAALIEIFTSPVEQVRRRGNGFCVNNYRDFFIRNLSGRKKTPREKLEAGLKKWNKKLFHRF